MKMLFHFKESRYSLVKTVFSEKTFSMCSAMAITYIFIDRRMIDRNCKKLVHC